METATRRLPRRAPRFRYSEGGVVADPGDLLVNDRAAINQAIRPR